MKTLKLFLFAAIFLTVWNPPARAWDPSELPPGFTVADPGAPVELEGKTLFRMRINYKMYTAEERAQDIFFRTGGTPVPLTNGHRARMMSWS